MFKSLKEYRSLGVLLIILFFSYVCFFFIFFLIIGNMNVDTLIGFGLVGLFFSVHRYGSKYVHAFFWEHTTKVYYLYSSLLSLTWNLKYFYISFVKSYSSFLKIKITTFFIISDGINFVYSGIVKHLMQLYFINDVYSILDKKLTYMNERKLIVFEYDPVIDNNELELFRTYSFILFLNG
jgi:hypothetical protein